MASPPATPAAQDVSCRAVRDLLIFLRAEGRAVGPLLAALRAASPHREFFAETYLDDPGNRVPWDVCADLLEATFKAVGDDAVRRYADFFFGQDVGGWSSALRPMFRLVTGPAQLYWLAMTWIGPSAFSHIHHTYERLADGRIRMELTLPPGYRGSEDFFRLTQGITERLPELVGLPPAMVESEVSERRGLYLISLPPSESVASRIRRRMLALFRVPVFVAELRQRDAQVRAAFGRLMAAREELETKVKERTEALERANRELSGQLTVLRRMEQIGDIGIWEWDIAGGRHVWSAGALRLYGLQPEPDTADVAASVQAISARILAEDLRVLADAARAVQAGEADSLDCEYRIRRPDGEIRHLHVRGEVERDAGGGPSRLVALLHDVTLRKRYERTLIEAKDAADQANRTKTDFLASMSHEIRTPMTSVLGFADLLAREDMPSTKRQAYVEKILRNGRHLLEVIDDILDLSKIESGHLTLQKVRFSPALEIGHAVDLLREQAERKGIRLVVELDPALPEHMHSDPVRFRQILINLLSNAVKFTDHGAVSVAAGVLPAEPAPAAGGRLIVTVRDTGIGIPPELQKALFRPFAPEPAAAAPRRGGAGLGLALARNLARALGGDLELAASDRGSGSTFRATVRLELERPSAGPSLTLDGGFTLRFGAGGLPGFPTGLKVLVVEDNIDIQEIIRRVLENVGAVVTCVGDGRECLQSTAETSFDLVVMDMQMPVVDGFAATRQLRAQGFRQPIVAITAFAVSGEREKCLNAGCNDFLPKPVDSLALIQTVARLGARRGGAPAP